MATPDPGAQGTPVGSPYGPPSGQHDQRLYLYFLAVSNQLHKFVTGMAMACRDGSTG